MTTHDINASYQDVSRYDQVTKAHTYRLAERPSDEFDDDYQICTFDIGPYLHGNAEGKANDVQGSVAAFGVEPKTPAERLERLQSHDCRYPVLLIEVDGRIIGSASLTNWSDRMAYDDTVACATCKSSDT